MEPERTFSPSPLAIRVEEMTFGKLFSAKRDAPEDLHVTSRSHGVDDRNMEASQLRAILDAGDLASLQIDPKSAARGAFLIRPLRVGDLPVKDVVLARARMRDHISLSGAKRAHPQMIVTVVALEDFRDYPTSVIEYARKKVADRVSMDNPSSSRFGFRLPDLEVAEADLTRPQPSRPTDEQFVELAPLLSAMFPDPGKTSRHNYTQTFGADDFPDEAAFLSSLSAALRYRPERSIMANLSIVVGLDLTLGGVVIRYLPSLRADRRRLSANELSELLRRIGGGFVPKPRLTPTAGARTSAVIDRTQRPAASGIAYRPPPNSTFSSKRTEPAAASKPQEGREQGEQSELALVAKFASALDRYRIEGDKAGAAKALLGAANSHLSNQIDQQCKTLPADQARAWATLRAYIKPPHAGSLFGQLFDGALLHHNSLGGAPPNALAASWFHALSEKVREVGLLTEKELEALRRRDLEMRLTDAPSPNALDRVWSDSLEFARDKASSRLVGQLSRRLDRTAVARKALLPHGLILGLNGLYFTNFDELVLAKTPKRGLGAAVF